MSELVLGVDGGGTKSHYALATLDGRLVDFIAGGAANHEVYADGFASARRELDRAITALLSRNGVAPIELAAAVLGIAGADVAPQRAEYTRAIEDLGIAAPLVCNDAFLGVKAGTSGGYGLCSVNGTGTAVAAIDPEGRRLQIGGTGPMSGDEAGATFIAQRGLRAAYDAIFRCGPPTALERLVLGTLGLGPGEEEDFAEAVHERGQANPRLVLEVTRLVFSCAAAGDGEAIGILRNSGVQMARSVAGAVRRLGFGDPVEVVIAGSESLKGECPALLEAFEAEARRLSPRQLTFIRLGAPPVLGALLWALETAGAADGVARRKIARELAEDLAASAARQEDGGDPT